MISTRSVRNSTMTRRQVAGGMAAAGLGLTLVKGVTLAQEAASTPSTTVPAGVALWTRFNLNSATDEQLLTIPGVGDQMLREFLEYRPYVSIVQFREEIGKYVDESEVANYEAYVFAPIDTASADADTFAQLPGVTSDIADQLVSAVSYASEADFLTALGSLVSADMAALASQYLVATAVETATSLKFNLNTATDQQFLTVPGVGDQLLREFNEYKPYASILEFRQELGKYVEEDQIASWEKYVFAPIDLTSTDAETIAQLPGVSTDKAETLVSGVPYADSSAFLSALGSLVSVDQRILAEAYLAQ